jgi:hypothetical protein
MESSKVDFFAVVKTREQRLGIMACEVMNNSEFPHVMAKGNSLGIDLPHNETIIIDVMVICGVFSKSIGSIFFSTKDIRHEMNPFPFAINATIDKNSCVRFYQPPIKGNETPIKSLVWFQMVPSLPGLKTMKIIQPYLYMYKNYRLATKKAKYIAAKMQNHHKQTMELQEMLDVCNSLQEISLRNLEEYELNMEKRLLSV